MPLKSGLLNTDAEIMDELATEAKRRLAAAIFKPGDVVRITDRTGLPDAAAARDIGVVLSDDADAPTTMVLCAHVTGALMAIPVRTAALKAASTEAVPAPAA